MKISLLRRRYSAVGGAERFTLRLAQMLFKRGHAVSICAESWPDARDGTYKIVHFRSGNVKAYARAAQEYVRDASDSLILSLERTLKQDIYRAGDGVHAAWLERRARFISPWKRAFSSWDPKHRSLLYLEKQVFTPEACAWIVSNSQMVKREILQRFDYPADRIRAIHPGVDLEKFQPCQNATERLERRKQLGLPLDDVIWSFVGSGFERKGLKWAIEIAAALQIPPVLAILGRGSQSPYRELARKLGVSAHFLPLGTEAQDVYHASDAFILPTIYDPCSNACLEAAACGLPIITTMANGAAEYVSGVFFEDPSHTEICAQACAGLNRPWSLDQLTRREQLDERPCWDALMQLTREAAAARGIPPG